MMLITPGGHTMSRFCFLLIWAFFMLVPATAAEPWSGEWKVSWPGGGGFLSLTQEGTDVRGSYRNGRGNIEATAQGAEINGEFIHDGLKEHFHATLGSGQNSFSGYTSGGEWLSGLRLSADETPGKQLIADLRAPRATMRSFLDAGNRAREGEPQALAVAVDAIDFGQTTNWPTLSAKFAAAEQLFGVVDLATFSLALIPERAATPRIAVSLPRLDAAPAVELGMARDADGAWRIIMPDAQSLAAMAGAVAARPADAFRQLQSPRDTLRSFLEGMALWDRGGEQEALSALDLTGVPEVLKQQHGRLMAHYLVRMIDMVGRMPLQSVPNSGLSREPFVYFEHPAGKIVIEPLGTGADTRWKFSAQTLQDLRRLFSAVQVLPEAHMLDPKLIPPSAMFAIRDQVKAYAPALLADIAGRGPVEYWQLLATLLLLSVIAAIAFTVKRIAFWVLERPALKRHVSNPTLLAWAIGIGFAVLTATQIVPWLGLPVSSRQYTLPFQGSLFMLIVAYAVWQVIGIISSVLEVYTDRSETAIDNILLTFMRGVLRLALIAGTGLALGHFWSVPTTGILAGLGIGGLAVAFASKETLANLFGAGILLGDRPFRKGDRIIAGDVNGWVEAVGLRSTRIRTLHDSLLVVPNSKLADTTINNLGARRRRTLTTSFLVTSGSTPEKLEAFTRAIFSRISEDPFFDRRSEVNINRITADGIQIEISTSLNTRRGYESRTATHRLYLDILQMAEAEGLTLGRGMEKNPVYIH
jgi:small-conductance mechanosensitive channel